MNQAVDCDSFPYADDSSLIQQTKDVKGKEKNLNKHFLDVCDWFVDSKHSIAFWRRQNNEFYLPQNIGLIKSAIAMLDMVKYTPSNITQ